MQRLPKVLCYVVAAGLLLAANLYATAPLAVTGVASNVFSSTVILVGTVNPSNEATYAFFQWGTTTNYGNVAAVGDLGSGTSDVVTQDYIGGLTANRVYHFRIVATNATATRIGNDATLTTMSDAIVFSGVGFENIDPDRPLGGELGSTWDDYMRQTRKAMRSFILTAFNLDGSFKTGIGTVVQTIVTNDADQTITNTDGLVAVSNLVFTADSNSWYELNAYLNVNFSWGCLVGITNTAAGDPIDFNGLISYSGQTNAISIGRINTHYPHDQFEMATYSAPTWSTNTLTNGICTIQAVLKTANTNADISVSFSTFGMPFGATNETATVGTGSFMSYRKIK
jgi:hypothetical protein